MQAESGSRLVSVVVPSFNQRQLLLDCLSSLLEQDYLPVETVVVDDGSTDGSSEATLRQFPTVKLIRNEVNSGFAVSANAGIAAATGDLVAVLNNDAQPEATWLRSLAEVLASDPRIAACASKVLNGIEPSKIESAGDEYRPWRSPRARGAGRRTEELNEQREVFGASASAAMYRRSALLETGGFDEDLGSYYEDVDLSVRLRLAGHRIVYAPKAVVRHEGHSSFDTPTMQFYLLRNDPLIYIKNMPWPVGWLFLPALLGRQIYQIVYYAFRGQLRLCLRAKLDVLRLLPRFWRKRMAIRRSRRIGMMQLLRDFYL